MELDKETSEAVNGIYYGTLADKISKNMKYTTSGILVGAFIGIGIASFMSKNRLFFGLGGAIIGGSIGMITSKRK